MGRVIASVRYIALIGVVFGLVAALAAFGWGSYKTVAVLFLLLHGEVDSMAVALVAVMDAFLIASGLLIFALGLYELFIGDIALPSWLVIRDLDALKAKVAGIVILAMAVSFLERLETHADPHDVLFSGIAVALVSGALVLLTRLGQSH